MKGKFSKTGIALVGCMLVCVILALAVGVPNGFFGDTGKGGDLDDENTPKVSDIVDGKTPIFMFDKSKDAMALMTAFDRGEIADVLLMFDPEGGNAPAESDDQDVIRQAYKALKNIVVLEATEDAGPECYHNITFTLNDGTGVTYSFDGTDILIYDDGTGNTVKYSIEGAEELQELYSRLAEQQ
ncbi:MAG: hypothetical protein MJ161_07120 [Clostridia bacterium]|nr:hypothetical protein [Clostridia bacterium]